MEQFFKEMKEKNETGNDDSRLNDLLKKGKNEVKRHYSLDAATPSPPSADKDGDSK